jgi:Mg-chelatase subunit ChlD
MAALAAVNLGRAMQCPDPGFAAGCIGYKGIGGGSNLLRQWFEHRDTLHGELRQRIKSIAREALTDLAFDRLARGSGSQKTGLVPQNRARPYRAGDELDQLDIDGTLEALITAGKPLDPVAADDLLVYDTARGQAAPAVLIDISGSMSGKDLAICAIAVVLLLGKLSSDELALAAFESDTHVLKGFDQEADLDAVADQLLDLKATGGTCVDAALKWAAGQFAGTEARTRLPFVLSDFCFSERADDVRRRAAELADLGVSYLAALHGYLCRECHDALLSVLGGHHAKLPNPERLPALLMEALQNIADGGSR